jgi:hypothetical protein
MVRNFGLDFLRAVAILMVLWSHSLTGLFMGSLFALQTVRWRGPFFCFEWLSNRRPYAQGVGVSPRVWFSPTEAIHNTAVDKDNSCVLAHTIGHSIDLLFSTGFHTDRC